MSADHPLLGHPVRVKVAADPFDGVIVSICADGWILVLCPSARLYRADPGTVTLLDPERATQMLCAKAVGTPPQDLTTDGRTLSQVCLELVEAKQAAARLNSALQDLAIELDLPVGLPERTILEAIRAKMGTPEYTPPRWVPAKDVEVGAPVLAVAYPNGNILPRAWDEEDWGPEDLDDGDGANTALVLVGKWPPLPRETT